jgi:hypothetical protein
MDHSRHGEHVAHSEHEAHAGHAGHSHPYRRLALMAVLSFVAMYIFMYAMVDAFDNVIPNFNQFYMAGLMAAPMVLIELVLMRSMYPDKRLNGAVAAVTVVLGLASWFAIRAQGGIGNEQFLRSMIPHHAGAILMCEKADISDPKIEKLCRDIIRSQQTEIAQMKSLLREQGA